MVTAASPHNGSVLLHRAAWRGATVEVYVPGLEYQSCHFPVVNLEQVSYLLGIYMGM